MKIVRVGPSRHKSRGDELDGRNSAPILNLQSRDLIEVSSVARRERRRICDANSADPQVVSSKTDLMSPPFQIQFVGLRRVRQNGDLSKGGHSGLKERIRPLGRKIPLTRF